MRRRDFITLLGGATAWPAAARAQQSDRVRRIGVLMGFDENDPVAKTMVAAFTQALAGLGWTNGRNLRMDLRWHGADTNRIRAWSCRMYSRSRIARRSYWRRPETTYRRSIRTLSMPETAVCSPTNPTRLTTLAA